MIKTHAMLMEELSGYAAPANKLARMVRDGEVTPVVRGLYETNRSTSAHLLAGSIYGPSYLSFDFALSYHGLIPEGVRVVTCATFEKGRKKRYDTPFGVFTYRDVPSAAFPLEIETHEEKGRHFRIASPEKALCDKLYSLRPTATTAEMAVLLFSDLRIDDVAFSRLDKHVICSLAEKYGCTSVKTLCRYLRRSR